jgi:fructose-specific phosphotransferase system IIC component
MNGAYWHLVLNHVPVVGVPVAFFLLAAGLARKSRDLVQAGFVILILMGLGAYPVVKTGGMAAGMIHGLPEIVPGSIHEHAEAADFGFWGCLIAGVISAIGFWQTRKTQQIAKKLTIVALIVSLWLSIVMARVAHLGGLIRHPEIVTKK